MTVATCVPLAPHGVRHCTKQAREGQVSKVTKRVTRLG
jgi:hypothetical protein